MWPGAPVVTTHVDATTDDPELGVVDLKDALDKLNQIIAHVSTFIQGLLDDTDAAAARTTLGLGALATKTTVATGDIDADAVTYARMQNVSATDKMLGRASAGAGDPEEIACTAAGRALIAGANATAQLATLGLVPANVTVQVFTSSGTYTPPAGLKCALVEVVGGGGGSGGCASTGAGQIACAGAGSSGGYARRLLTAAQIGASQTVTIGTAGTGGSSGNNPGNGGGNTTFGALLTGGGGNGGQQGNAVSPPLIGTTVCVAGGVGSGGDLNVVGGSGGYGFGVSQSSTMGGAGGNSFFGGGAPAASGGPRNATGYGGGGGSPAIGQSTGSQAGGNGFAGVCIVTEFYG